MAGGGLHPEEDKQFVEKCKGSDQDKSTTQTKAAEARELPDLGEV